MFAGWSEWACLRWIILIYIYRWWCPNIARKCSVKRVRRVDISRSVPQDCSPFGSGGTSSFSKRDWATTLMRHWSRSRRPSLSRTSRILRSVISSSLNLSPRNASTSCVLRMRQPRNSGSPVLKSSSTIRNGPWTPAATKRISPFPNASPRTNASPLAMHLLHSSPKPPPLLPRDGKTCRTILLHKVSSLSCAFLNWRNYGVRKACVARH